MGKVSVSMKFPATVHDAETCWYEVDGWPAWVDGLSRVAAVEGDWPGVGASVTWESGPAGRGRVVELVIAHEPLEGQSLEVDDNTLAGRQSVTFTPAGEEVEVQLSLDYRIKQRSIFTPVVDLLFVRRVMAASLRRTLQRFGAQLTARQTGLG